MTESLIKYQFYRINIHYALLKTHETYKHHISSTLRIVTLNVFFLIITTVLIH